MNLDQLSKSAWRILPFLCITGAPAAFLYGGQSPDYWALYVIVTVGAYLVAVAAFRSHWIEDLDEVRQDAANRYSEAHFGDSVPPAGTYISDTETLTVTYAPGKVTLQIATGFGDATHTFDPKVAHNLSKHLSDAADKAETPEQDPPTIWERLDQ